MILLAAWEVSGKLKEEVQLGGGQEELEVEVYALHRQEELRAGGEARKGQGDHQIVDEQKTLSSLLTGSVRLVKGWTLLDRSLGAGQLICLSELNFGLKSQQLSDQ